jgi:hypothetical protein
MWPGFSIRVKMNWRQSFFNQFSEIEGRLDKGGDLGRSSPDIF